MSLALKLALSPLLVVQALHTRARVPSLPEAAGAGVTSSVGAVRPRAREARMARMSRTGASRWSAWQSGQVGTSRFMS